jgi:aspartate/methionine/tyrosine aminotransferase
VRFSSLTGRIGGSGADAWLTHYEAADALARGEDVIVLSVGDPDIETPAPVLERAIEQLRCGDTHYVAAAGRPALREAIARAHEARTGQAVQADNVVYLAGAQNALFAASLCLAGPGDEVVSFEPMYPTYPATLEVSGARLVRAPSGAALRPDLQALAALITPRTRMIVWASPNNPSGFIMSDSELAVIGELARRHDLWLVVDEVYAGLAPGGRVPGLAGRLPDRVVTLGSLSKSHAMTGWRAGWLIGPRELAVKAELLDYCRGRQRRFAAGLRAIPKLRLIEPEAGMFMLIDVSGMGLTGGEFVRALYAAEKVSVMDGAAFGASTAACVRVCFATDEANIDAACERIRRFCAR